LSLQRLAPIFEGVPYVGTTLQGIAAPGLRRRVLTLDQLLCQQVGLVVSPLALPLGVKGHIGNKVALDFLLCKVVIPETRHHWGQGSKVAVLKAVHHIPSDSLHEESRTYAFYGQGRVLAPTA